MDKLKYIQIQNQDGSYGDNIPLQTTSQFITMKDGNTLQLDFDNLKLSDSQKVTKENGKGLSQNDFTDDLKTKLEGIETNANKIQIDTTLTQSNQAADAAAVGAMINDLRSQIGTPPMLAKTAAAMINKNRIYVYTGNEQGYQHGYWYYYENGAWVPGDVYSAVAVSDQLRESINQEEERLNNVVTQKTSELETFTQTKTNELNQSVRDQVAIFTRTSQNLTQRVEAAEGKINPANERMDSIEQSLSGLQSTITNNIDDFVTYGQVDENGVANFTNRNGEYLFSITGVGGSGGGDIIIDPSMQDDDAATAAQRAAMAAAQSKDQAQIHEENAEKWATGATGGASSATNNAKYWSNISKSFAQGGTDLRDDESSNNAKYWNDRSKIWAVGRNDNTQASDTNNAKYWATQAKSSENNAQKWTIGIIDDNVQPTENNNAKYWATQAAPSIVDLRAQSWVHGGTGSRDGEDNDNAEYFYTLSKLWTIGPVSENTEYQEPSEINNARYWAQRAKEYIQEDVTTELVSRKNQYGEIVSNAEDSFVNIQNNILQMQEDISSLTDDKVDQLESKFKLNVDLEGNDKTLYNLMVSLKWWDDVKITE